MVLKLLVIVLPLNTALSMDIFLLRQLGAPLRRMGMHWQRSRGDHECA
ncbi:hypothetical protein K788_0008241 [Paraburkholderia caribensis MBA4]|uniref:Uncharacterized protein n=1 Tax=Paraburkholderia caribensis MBA4 TaxID=1323664 RepID=A0A0P0RER8_9BURK|nr:hypothetical protein K788_0008241 [Paraburkholderia caribensis MBA4]